MTTKEKANKLVEVLVSENEENKGLAESENLIIQARDLDQFYITFKGVKIPKAVKAWALEKVKNGQAPDLLDHPKMHNFVRRLVDKYHDEIHDIIEDKLEDWGDIDLRAVCYISNSYPDESKDYAKEYDKDLKVFFDPYNAGGGSVEDDEDEDFNV